VKADRERSLSFLDLIKLFRFFEFLLADDTQYRFFPVLVHSFVYFYTCLIGSVWQIFIGSDIIQRDIVQNMNF